MPNETNLGGVIGAVVPTVQIWGTALISTVAWIIFIVFFIIIAGVIAYILVMRATYRNKIILFEKINGRWIDTKKDKASEIKFGDLGTILLYCKKHKKYLPRPAIQSGIRKFYYRIKADGNWENFEFIDDEKSDTMKFASVEKNITERNVGIRKGLGERYKKTNWLKENAVMLISIGFIILIGVMGWLYIDKVISLTGKLGGVADTLNEIMKKQDSILGHISNMQGGSGIVKVP
jgi:hypothetical protein